MAQLEDGVALMADVSYAAPKFSGTMPTYWDFYFWGTEGMLKFNLLDNKIYLYRENEEQISCPDSILRYRLLLRSGIWMPPA